MSDAIKKTIKGVIDRYLIRREINGSFVSQVYRQATSIENMSNCMHSVSRTSVTFFFYGK